MKHLSLLLPLALVIACSRVESFAQSAPFADADIVSPQAWSATALPGEWAPLPGGTAGMTELKSPGLLFTQQPLRVIATRSATGVLARLDVLYVNGAQTPADAVKQVWEGLKTGITAKCGALQPAAGAALPGKEPEAYEAVSAGAKVQLKNDAAKGRIMVTILPSAAGAVAGAKESGKPGTKTRVQTLPNGDVVLVDLPKQESFPPLAQDDEFAAALFWMQSFYGWKADVLEGLKSAGAFDPSSKFTNYYDFIKKFVPSKCGAKFNGTKSFDMRSVMRELDKGVPVMVWRIFTDERDKTLQAFAQQFAQDDKATLPNPKNAAEKKNWPVFSQALYDQGKQTETASVIYGYHKERGEVLFTDFNNGPEAEHLRMTGEEMNATCRVMILFE